MNPSTDLFNRSVSQVDSAVNKQSAQSGGDEAGRNGEGETTNEAQQTGEENNDIMKAQPGDEDFVGPVKSEDGIIGYQGRSKTRPIFEFEHDGDTQHVAIQ